MPLRQLVDEAELAVVVAGAHPVEHAPSAPRRRAARRRRFGDLERRARARPAARSSSRSASSTSELPLDDVAGHLAVDARRPRRPRRARPARRATRARQRRPGAQTWLSRLPAAPQAPSSTGAAGSLVSSRSERTTPHAAAPRRVAPRHGDQEGDPVDREELAVASRRHRRGPDHVGEQRDLAEEAAARRDPDVLAAHHDVEVAVGHRVEAVARIALAHDGLAGAHLHVLGRPGHRLEGDRCERGEHGKRAEQAHLDDGDVGAGVGPQHGPAGARAGGRRAARRRRTGRGATSPTAMRTWARPEPSEQARRPPTTSTRANIEPSTRGSAERWSSMRTEAVDQGRRQAEDRQDHDRRRATTSRREHDAQRRRASARLAASHGASDVRRTTTVATAALTSAPAPTRALSTPAPVRAEVELVEGQHDEEDVEGAEDRVAGEGDAEDAGDPRAAAQQVDRRQPARPSAAGRRRVAGRRAGPWVRSSTATTDVSASAAQAHQRAPSGPPIESRPAATSGPASAPMHSQYEIHRLPDGELPARSHDAGQQHRAGRAERAHRAEGDHRRRDHEQPPGARPPRPPRPCRTPPPARRARAGGPPADGARSSSTAAIGAPTSVGARIATDAKPVDRGAAPLEGVDEHARRRRRTRRSPPAGGRRRAGRAAVRAARSGLRHARARHRRRCPPPVSARPAVPTTRSAMAGE